MKGGTNPEQFWLAESGLRTRAKKSQSNIRNRLDEETKTRWQMDRWNDDFLEKAINLWLKMIVKNMFQA